MSERIGLVVSATTEVVALANAHQVIETLMAGVYPNHTHTRIGTWPLETPEGTRETRALWDAQVKTNVTDLLTLTEHLAAASIVGRLRRQSRMAAAADGLLDNLDFRAACYRLGAVEGYPVCLYDEMGIGITMPSNLERLFHSPAFYWLVLVELKEVSAPAS